MTVDYSYRRYPNRLRAIRQNAGYSQQAVARLLRHKNSSLLSRWEGEKAIPSVPNLIRLCILYGKTVQELYPEYCKRIEQALQDP